MFKGLKRRRFEEYLYENINLFNLDCKRVEKSEKT